MRTPELTQEDIKSAVEYPDLYTIECQDHVFYTKDIKGKGKLIVYGLWDEENKAFNIQCADWLVSPYMYCSHKPN